MNRIFGTWGNSIFEFVDSSVAERWAEEAINELRGKEIINEEEAIKRYGREEVDECIMVL